jgi:hypothetical protein
MTSMRVVLTFLVPCWVGAVVTAGCGSGDDKCAVAQENCSSGYLQSKGKTGCCAGLTCKTSASGYLICQ